MPLLHSNTALPEDNDMIQSLYTIVLIEAVIGGGGRVFSIGPITLRMLLFLASLLLWLSASFRRKRRDGQALAIFIVYMFFASILPGLFVDAIKGPLQLSVLSEIQPMLFWLTAPFVAMAIYDNLMVERAALVIMYGGLLVACFILAIMGALTLGVLPFTQFYSLTAGSGELFFRSETLFFFKGHFYVGLALIFVIILKPKHWRIVAFICAVAIAASLTRGLIFAALIASTFGLMSMRNYKVVMALALCGLLFVTLSGQSVILDFFNTNDRGVSLSVRQADFWYFFENFNLVKIVFGEGAGTLLNNRPAVENSYLWSIWRFGFLGLAFLTSPFLIGLYFYSKVGFGHEYHALASAFFYGIVMLFILTAINPFINNSIGISYALVAIFSLRRISLSPPEASKKARCNKLDIVSYAE